MKNCIVNVGEGLCYMHDHVGIPKVNNFILSDVDVHEQLNLKGTSGHRRHTVAWKVVLRLSVSDYSKFSNIILVL